MRSKDTETGGERSKETETGGGERGFHTDIHRHTDTDTQTHTHRHTQTHPPQDPLPPRGVPHTHHRDPRQSPNACHTHTHRHTHTPITSAYSTSASNTPIKPTWAYSRRHPAHSPAHPFPSPGACGPWPGDPAPPHDAAVSPASHRAPQAAPLRAQ
jgi:hypothetical protein